MKDESKNAYCVILSEANPVKASGELAKMQSWFAENELESFVGALRSFPNSVHEVPTVYLAAADMSTAAKANECPFCSVLLAPDVQDVAPLL